MADLIDGADLGRWLRKRRSIAPTGLVTEERALLAEVLAEVDQRVRSPARFHGDYRVVISGDVVSLPDEHWSCGNFGDGISEEWLLGGGSVPFPGKSKARKRLLAYFVRRGLADHHSYPLEAGAWPGDGGAPGVTHAG